MVDEGCISVIFLSDDTPLIVIKQHEFAGKQLDVDTDGFYFDGQRAFDQRYLLLVIRKEPRSLGTVSINFTQIEPLAMEGIRQFDIFSSTANIHSKSDLIDLNRMVLDLTEYAKGTRDFRGLDSSLPVAASRVPNSAERNLGQR
jgi:hypothetical protein